MNMAYLEHQARLYYLAMCIAARVANIEGDRQDGEGIGDIRELVTADM